MEREIRFRGQRLDNREFVTGHYTQGTENNHYITRPDGSVWEVDPKTIGEFSGFLDNTQKEIFEADIVKVKNTPFGSFEIVHEGRKLMAYEKYTTCKVVYENGAFCLHSTRKIKISIPFLGKMPQQDYAGAIGYHHSDIEVIGNIYESQSELQ